MQFPRQPQVRLVITRILRPPHPARRTGRRCPPPRRSSAPRPAASCSPWLAFADAHPPFTACLRLPKIPVAMLWELRFGNVVRVVHIARSRGHLRALTASNLHQSNLHQSQIIKSLFARIICRIKPSKECSNPETKIAVIRVYGLVLFLKHMG
jgi:hypothetical protein